MSLASKTELFTHTWTEHQVKSFETNKVSQQTANSFYLKTSEQNSKRNNQGWFNFDVLFKEKYTCMLN